MYLKGKYEPGWLHVFNIYGDSIEAMMMLAFTSNKIDTGFRLHILSRWPNNFL